MERSPIKTRLSAKKLAVEREAAARVAAIAVAEASSIAASADVAAASGTVITAPSIFTPQADSGRGTTPGDFTLPQDSASLYGTVGDTRSMRTDRSSARRSQREFDTLSQFSTASKRSAYLREQASLRAMEEAAAIEREIEQADRIRRLKLAKQKEAVELAKIDADEEERAIRFAEPPYHQDDAVSAHDSIKSWLHNINKPHAASDKLGESPHRVKTPPSRRDASPSTSRGRSLTPRRRARNELMAAHTQIIVDSMAQLNMKREEKLDYRSVCRTLPTFGGAISDWMSFKRAYEDSKLYGRFTVEENLARLRLCLRGEAREAVSTLLSCADDPDEIVNTLEEQFAHPTLLVDEQVHKIRALPRLPLEFRSELPKFASVVYNAVTVLEKMKKYNHRMRSEVHLDILDKFPITLHARWVDWANINDDNVESKSKLLARFLRTEVQKIRLYGAAPKEAALPPPPARERARISAAPRTKQQVLATQGSSNKNMSSCDMCTGKHETARCVKFLKMTIPDRWDWTKKERVCFRCLKGKHRVMTCKSRQLCGKDGCARWHHPQLHNDRTTDAAVQSSPSPAATHAAPQDNAASTSSSESSHATATASASTATASYGRAYLKITPVVLSGPKGTVHTYALLDEGSTVSLMDDGLARRLGLEGENETIEICGVAHAVADTTSRKVSLKIRGAGGRKTHSIRARTLAHLTLSAQSINVDLNTHAHLKGLSHKLLYTNARPEILIGQDNADLIVTRKLRAGKQNEPMASKTELGWIVHGYNAAANGSSKVKSYTVMNIELQELVKRSYDLDALGVRSGARIHAGEERALRILAESTKQVEGGRWQTGLLWKDDNHAFPSSFEMALNRLRSIQKKLRKDVDYAAKYASEIDKLVERGYAEPCYETSTPQKTWYLPHFGVINPNKPSKMRLVFDAAAKVGKVCLNDYLLTGPDLLNSLLGILLRFREGRFAVTADIQEMFLRVKIKEQDRDALRFLWQHPKRGGKVIEYRMTSLIFGATSSPCTAIYAKDKNAETYAVEFPEAAAVTKKNFYMDDCVHSCTNEEAMVRLTSDLRELHKKGGFELTGWASNSKKVLESLPAEAKSQGQVDLTADVLTPEKTLGIMWDPMGDTLGFNLSMNRVPNNIINGNNRPTKRQVLSVVMSVFDPVGLASPITIRGRILLQEIWRSKTAWDSQLQDRHQEKWLNWLEDMKTLRNCKIPRCYAPDILLRATELHTFCDASESGYGCACYWRYETENGTVYVALAASKARVAPLRSVSIPRLELQAALLGARLAKTIVEEHERKPETKYFWTDSRTALAWIKTDPRNFKAYVANRLGEIDELTERDQWRWVPTTENPADLVTRDVGELQMDPQGKWFRGPRFLSRPYAEWPAQPLIEQDSYAEERKSEIVNHATTEISHAAVPDENRFSSWSRLLRATAYVLLFIDLLQKRATGLNKDHLYRAEVLLIKKSQDLSFKKEKKEIKDGRLPQPPSRLCELQPMLDKHGVIRLQGRIRKANIKSEMKTPVILDGDNKITRLLVLDYHRRANHASAEMVVNELRQKYWVLKLRPTVRSVASKCQACRLQRAKAQQPPMGDLPIVRVEHHHRPFTNTGIDYFGPMTVTIGRRHEKRWGVLMTCLTTRAVHIELAASLNTDSAIMAIRRFMARRGPPAIIMSDNGTNFHGADNELKKTYAELDQDQIQQYALSRGAMWKFIPPMSPHVGGSWERLVSSIKKALRATLNERSPKEEVLSTLLAEAEYSVNSRPLTHVSVDPRDPEALTPNHFLLGSSSGLPTPGSFDDGDLIRRRQWRTSQRLADMFWARWVKEYLPTLQPRTMKGNSKDLKEGDIVIVADPASPRNCWPRGRVQRIYPGDDGHVRVIEIQTSTGLLKRSAQRVIALPTDAEG